MSQTVIYVKVKNSKKEWYQTRVVVQWVKPLLAMSAYPMSASSCSNCSASGPAPCWCSWESSGEWPNYVGCCHTGGRWDGVIGFGLAQPQPFGKWTTEWMEDISLSPSPFLSLSLSCLFFSLSPLCLLPLFLLLIFKQINIYFKQRENDMDIFLSTLDSSGTRKRNPCCGSTTIYTCRNSGETESPFSDAKKQNQVGLWKVMRLLASWINPFMWINESALKASKLLKHPVSLTVSFPVPPWDSVCKTAITTCNPLSLDQDHKPK